MVHLEVTEGTYEALKDCQEFMKEDAKARHRLNASFSYDEIIQKGCESIKAIMGAF